MFSAHAYPFRRYTGRVRSRQYVRSDGSIYVATESEPGDMERCYNCGAVRATHDEAGIRWQRWGGENTTEVLCTSFMTRREFKDLASGEALYGLLRSLAP